MESLTVLNLSECLNSTLNDTFLCAPREDENAENKHTEIGDSNCIVLPHKKFKYFIYIGREVRAPKVCNILVMFLKYLMNL